MSTPKKTVLEPLRVRIRRFQFTVGLGFLSLALGSVLAGALGMRLADRVRALPFEFLQAAIVLVLMQLWVLTVLPALCYGAARIIELRPWSTALGAALTGQAFRLAIDFTSNGVDGWVKDGWLLTLLEWAVFAGGVVLSRQAVLWGRAASAKQAEQAQQQAAEKKDEYAEFLREAERAGEKIAQREALKTGEQDTPEQKPKDEPKAPAA